MSVRTAKMEPEWTRQDVSAFACSQLDCMRYPEDWMPVITHRATLQHRGFTLIELLIVVAVVAILAVIALPSYQAQVRKGHRAAAQSYMMDLAQRQGHYLLAARAYAPTEAALGYPATPADVASYYAVDPFAVPAVSP